MRHTILDLETYNRTRGLEGGAIYTVVEEGIEPLEMVVDEGGVPTRTGIIGYYLGSALILFLFAYIFIVL